MSLATAPRIYILHLEGCSEEQAHFPHIDKPFYWLQAVGTFWPCQECKDEQGLQEAPLRRVLKVRKAIGKLQTAEE